MKIRNSHQNDNEENGEADHGAEDRPTGHTRQGASRTRFKTCRTDSTQITQQETETHFTGGDNPLGSEPL